MIVEAVLEGGGGHNYSLVGELLLDPKEKYNNLITAYVSP